MDLVLLSPLTLRLSQMLLLSYCMDSMLSYAALSISKDLNLIGKTGNLVKYKHRISTGISIREAHGLEL